MSDALASAERGTQLLLGLGTTLVVVTGMFVAARIIWDVKATGKLNADDYLSIAAVVLLAATHGIFYEFLVAYTTGAASFYFTSQLIVAQAIVSGFATWFAKTPVLVLYLRLFGVRTWVRVVVWSVLVATALAYLIAISYNAAGCTPPSRDVGLEFVMDCTHLSSVAGVSLGGIAVATDTIIFLIPIPIIFRLHLSLSKKIGLALVFLAGSLAIVASAVALSFKVGSLSGESTDVTTAVILTIVELSIAICVGCAPAARSFWIDIVGTTALYVSLASWVSSLTLVASSSTKGSQTSTKKKGNSSVTVGKDGSEQHHHTFGRLNDNESAKSAHGPGTSEVQLVDIERHQQPPLPEATYIR